MQEQLPCACCWLWGQEQPGVHGLSLPDPCEVSQPHFQHIHPSAHLSWFEKNQVPSVSDSRHPLTPGTSSSPCQSCGCELWGSGPVQSVPQCCVLVAAELQGPGSLDIPVIACVNSLPWNSFSEDGPPWGEV